jgi:single-strand DNA-binding protein
MTRRTTRAGTQAGTRASTVASTAQPAANEVHLIGRVAGAAVSRILPSGDTVTMLRVVVDRPPSARRQGGAGSDTVDCAMWTARLRQRAGAVTPGTVVEIDGALRRRFWRTAGGPASRYEVEVSALRRVSPTASPERRPRAGPG